MKKFLILTGLMCACLNAFAQTTDPVKAVEEITAYRTTQLNEAAKAKKTPDFAAIDKEVTARAEKMLEGVDLSSVSGDKAIEWARLCQLAKRNKDVCDLAMKFLTTKPEAPKKFEAHMMMLRACNALGEADMIVMTLGDVEPYDLATRMGLATMTAGSFANTIEGKLGAEKALSAIQIATAKFPKADEVSEKDRPRWESAVSSIAQSTAELLVSLKRDKEAIEVLDKAIATLGEKSTLIRSLNSKKSQLTLTGSVAPALPSEKAYGEYVSLEALKGKVVLVDFFAHWCGPCIRSFPDMKQLYTDFKDKGLEVIAVTSYYGYYRTENAAKRDMPKEVEFAKMGEFIKEHALPWPVIYTDKANYAPFGVSGIPHVVVIDRKGIVHKIKVGYSPESFKEFRTEVEKLINEK